MLHQQNQPESEHKIIETEIPAQNRDWSPAPPIRNQETTHIKNQKTTYPSTSTNEKFMAKMNRLDSSRMNFSAINFRFLDFRGSAMNFDEMFWKSHSMALALQNSTKISKIFDDFWKYFVLNKIEKRKPSFKRLRETSSKCLGVGDGKIEIVVVFVDVFYNK